MAEKRKDSKGRVLPENVTQRKDGSYMWRKNIRGKQYTLYAKTLGEIKQKRNVALGEIEAGTYKGKHKKMQEDRELAKKDITLNEWFFQWEKVYRIGKVKQNTLHGNHRLYINYFSGNIGQMKVKDVKHMHVAQILNELHKGGLSYGSLERCNSVLVVMFDAAIKNGLIEDNPAKSALTMKREKPKHLRALSAREEERFLDYVRNDRYYKRYEPLFTVGFKTGMRIGEILALTWNDIDFENNVVHVNKTLVEIKDLISGGKGHIAINSPKTEKSIRDVPMVSKVKEAFLKQKEIQPRSKAEIDGYSNFVFTARTGNPFYSSNIRKTINLITKAINNNELKAARAEGREPELIEHFSPHCMRHTFATRCYEKGVKEKVMQEILGHSKIDMTLNIYTHVTEDMILDDMAKLEE